LVERSEIERNPAPRRTRTSFARNRISQKKQKWRVEIESKTHDRMFNALIISKTNLFEIKTVCRLSFQKPDYSFHFDVMTATVFLLGISARVGGM
jgi:hypothetical protein